MGPSLIVHATNVVGLGAVRLAQSLLPAIEGNVRIAALTLLLPDQGELAGYVRQREATQVQHYRRSLPKGVSRLVECLRPPIRSMPQQAVLVLGDLPLRGIERQTLLLHSANLLVPEEQVAARLRLRMAIGRRVLAQNLRWVDSVVVQGGFLQALFQWRFPAHAHKLVVVGHPPPTLYASAAPVRQALAGGRLRLFYPSAAYDHKNHALLRRLGELDVIDRITVTLDRDEVDGLDRPMFRFVGRLSELDCLLEYRRSHALLFVSRLESFGLPLVEAMSLGLPIICPDLPYARDLCGDQAVYFADNDADSLGRAIVSLHRRLVSGWHAQWHDRLARLPRDWAEVADRLIAVSLGHRPGLNTG